MPPIPKLKITIKCLKPFSLLGKIIFIFTVALGLLQVGGCGEKLLPSNIGPIPPQNIPNEPVIDSDPPKIISDPIILMAPNPGTPLVGVLDLKTDEPTRVLLEINYGNGDWIINFDELNTDHSLPVFGFRPAQTHKIKVSVIDESGNKTIFEDLLEATTEPLPGDFPPISVWSVPEEMEPGFTIFTITGIGPNSGIGFIVIVNEFGEVVWFHSEGVLDIRMNAAGNLLTLIQAQSVLEMDLLGNYLQRWSSEFAIVPESIVIPTRAFHHEVFEMENGHLLALSMELREFQNYPSSDTDPLTPKEIANVVGDVIVEFTPDGEVVQEWKMLDIIDPYRIGYGSLGQSYNGIFSNPGGGTRDWTHGNGVIHDPKDDSIIVSLRHQDAIVKFKRKTNELVWILGPHENWDPILFGPYLLDPIDEDEFFWSYHQHAPMITPNGTILLFDNGNFRASPFDEKLTDDENFSRAVEYSINEETMEITKVWEYGQFEDEILYAGFVGDADFLAETENVLITFGGISTPNGVTARIIEVNHKSQPEKVFDLSIEDVNWFTYRSERILSLYPQ